MRLHEEESHLDRPVRVEIPQKSGDVRVIAGRFRGLAECFGRIYVEVEKNDGVIIMETSDRCRFTDAEGDTP